MLRKFLVVAVLTLAGRVAASPVCSPIKLEFREVRLNVVNWEGRATQTVPGRVCFLRNAEADTVAFSFEDGRTLLESETLRRAEVPGNPPNTAVFGNADTNLPILQMVVIYVSPNGGMVLRFVWRRLDQHEAVTATVVVPGAAPAKSKTGGTREL